MNAVGFFLILFWLIVGFVMILGDIDWGDFWRKF